MAMVMLVFGCDVHGHVAKQCLLIIVEGPGLSRNLVSSCKCFLVSWIMDIVTVLVTLMVTGMVFMTVMMIEGNTSAVLGSTCSLPKS